MTARGNVNSVHPRGTFRWTPELERRVKRLYLREGLALSPIAREIGCASSTVQLLLNRRDWMRAKPMQQTRDREWVTANRALVKQDYVLLKLTAQEIAAKYGVSYVELCKHINRQRYARSLSETFRLISVPKGRHQCTRFHASNFDRWFNRNHSIVSYKDYVRVVRRATAAVAHRYRKVLDPKGKRRWLSFEIDHLISIRAAYRKGRPLSLRLVAHPANLALVTTQDNKLKADAPAFSTQELKRRIALFEAKHGAVFSTMEGGRVQIQ